MPNVWDYQGTAAYLLGMGYFQKNDAFDVDNQQWHKVRDLIKFSSGLGRHRGDWQRHQHAGQSGYVQLTAN